MTGDGGYLAAAYDWYPYGTRMRTGLAGSASDSRRVFTGHERDLATGLDYMMARYYSQSIGRFLGVDPMLSAIKDSRLPARWNRTAYALGNPVVLLDPDGRDVIAHNGQRFEVYPGDVLVFKSASGGPHVATYVGDPARRSGSITVVDNTSARNENLSRAGLNEDKARATRPDNTGSEHKPNNVTAPVNGQPSPYSAESGASLQGVIPALAIVSRENGTTAASGISMYHQDSAGLQIFDFVTKLDEILGTGINAEATEKALEEKIDPSRKLDGRRAKTQEDEK